jgi:hypothetical protein
MTHIKPVSEPTLSNRPSATELLQAVRQHLHDKTLPLLDGNEAFYLRVALNALGMVERELCEGQALAAADRQELATLLGKGLSDKGMQSNDETSEGMKAEVVLQNLLRSGALNISSPGLFDYLVARTKRRLAVDNPRYRHEPV